VGRVALSSAVILAFGLVLTFVASSVRAQRTAVMDSQLQARMDSCFGESAAPDQRIDACTNLIQEGQLAPASAANATYNRGNAYLSKRSYDQAIADYTRALALNPELAQGYNNRCAANLGKGLDDQAIADCSKAIDLKSSDAKTYYDRGNAYMDKSLYDRAIADYTQAIALNPDYAKAYGNRGAAYASKGLNAEAVADFRTTLTIDPNDRSARDELTTLGARP
jgi:tetratricopeptide (TPR) repeat protein